MERIDGSTKIIGVLGHPISHSLSPLMHNRAIDDLHLNYVYLAFDVLPQNLGNFVRYFKSVENFVGFNITIPYKQSVIKFLDGVDPLAKRISAVNTVVKREGKLIGFNTDATGFINSLKGVINPRGKNVLLLGAGGAGSAISHALIDQGIKRLYIYDILLKRAKFLAKVINKNVEVVRTPEEPLNNIHLLINATPVGMKKGEPPPINLKLLPTHIVVYDIIYNRETELLKFCRKAGIKSIDGKKMLVYQGGESFKLWTGKRPSLELMLRSIENSFRRK